MKHLLLAPAAGLALLSSACTTDDLAAFSDGLSMAAVALDNELNPPCPYGMVRVAPDLVAAPAYPAYPYQSAYYPAATPGQTRYSGCSYVATYDHDHDDHHRRDRHHGRRDRDRPD